MSRALGVVISVALALTGGGPAWAQGDPPSVARPMEVTVTEPPPPTILEGFNPIGSVVTMGYTDVGSVSAAGATVRVDARELRASPGGQAVRGLVVDVIESQTRRDRSFVDVDEIPNLISGIDALLDVRANPTSFDRFELRYVTRGELRVSTLVTTRGTIVYVVQAGRTTRAQASLELADLVKLRGLFAGAAAKLNVTDGGQ